MFPLLLPNLSMFHTQICQHPISARLKMSFHGEESLCVRKSHCCQRCRRNFFPPCLRHMFFLSLLSAPRHPRSICIRPLREFCEGCFLLFSLRGPDCSEPQAAEKDSRSHLSLSARLLVPDDGCFLLIGFPVGWCRVMIPDTMCLTCLYICMVHH